MGEVLNGKYHGKGLFYRKESNQWEFSLYKEGKIVNTIEAGEGRPQYLEISKDILADEHF